MIAWEIWYWCMILYFSWAISTVLVMVVKTKFEDLVVNFRSFKTCYIMYKKIHCGSFSTSRFSSAQREKYCDFCFNKDSLLQNLENLICFRISNKIEPQQLWHCLDNWGSRHIKPSIPCGWLSCVFHIEGGFSFLGYLCKGVCCLSSINIISETTQAKLKLGTNIPAHSGTKICTHHLDLTSNMMIKAFDWLKPLKTYVPTNNNSNTGTKIYTCV